MENIRLAYTLSVENYIDLCLSAGWPKPDEKQSARSLQNSDYLVSAVDEYSGKVVGMARSVGDGAMAEMIIDVVVCPEYQGMGIGTCMINDLIERIKTQVQSGQKVMITLISALRKEKFYEKFGFTSHPNESYGNGMYLWHMK